METTSKPWHFWPVAVISPPWNAFGAYDYVMTNLRDADYLKQFPPEMMDYIDEMPFWAMACWAIGVWGAVLGSVLLLARSRFAVHAFVASLLGLVASTAYQASLDIPTPMLSGPMLAMTVVIWIAAVFFVWYAMRMRKAGVLR
jgi:hypothetical protein